MFKDNLSLQKFLYANNLKFYRKLANLNQDELAMIINVDPSFISYLESAKKNPTLATMARISVALHQPLYKFFLWNKKIKIRL